MQASNAHAGILSVGNNAECLSAWRSYCISSIYTAPVCLQAASQRHKQPSLSIVSKLHAMMAHGRLCGKFVANDCIISPVIGSKGQFWEVQQMPLPTPCVTQAVDRRHQ